MLSKFSCAIESVIPGISIYCDDHLTEGNFDSSLIQ